MRAAEAVGRTIVEVRQRVVWNERLKQNLACIDAIVLDNGICLIPTVDEWGGDYSVDMLVVRRAKK